MSRRVDVLLAGAIAVLLWMTRWHFPESSAAPLLDPSFMQALGYALVHRMQFGADLVYTYGPLGWFNVKPHQPELYWVACIGWELCFKLALAVFLGAAALRLRSRLALGWFALALVLPDMGFDAYFFLAILAVSAWAIPRAQRSWPVIVCALAALVGVGLVKFTYTLLVLVAAACIAAQAGRRAGMRSVATVLLFLCLLVASWWALGQSPLNLPAWFASSARLASAFGTAQSIAPSPTLLGAALFVIAASLATLGIAVRGAGDRVEARLFGVVWIAALFLAYKAGFTRAFGNEITFFGFAGAAPFLLSEPTQVSHRARRVFELCRATASVAALIGFCAAYGESGTSPIGIAREFGRDLARNVRTVTSLAQHQRLLEDERLALARKYVLPRTRSAVGDATIDVFGSEQGFVFLNDLRWHPRPVFQAFAVMTDAMSRANARFLEGPDAPRFVLHAPDQIDGRLVGMEDARSLHVLLRDYRAVARERGMMLFERRSDAPRADMRQVVLEKRLVPGETLELAGLEGRVLLLEVDAGLDVLGRLRTLALGAPVLQVEIETSDGIRETDRVVPGMIAGGAVVRPWLQSGDDWVRWVVGEEVHGIARLRFVDASGRWRTPFVVRVLRADALQPEVDPEVAPGISWSMFTPPPSRVDLPSAPERTTLRGYREALVVHAPSALYWTLAPGTYALRAQFGFVPDAWRAGHTDGAIVRVERRGPGAARTVVWERALDPAGNVPDGKMQDLDLELFVAAGEEIVLVTNPGPAGDAERDWVFWAELAFTRLR